MKSEWKVASNYFGGDKPFYQVYRKIDAEAKIDHSGNREYEQGVFADKVAAQAFADDLNARDRKASKDQCVQGGQNG